MLEGGLGLTLKANKGMNYYVEVSQYNMKTKGRQTFVDNRNDLHYNLWFNRIIFRVGVTRYLFK